MRENPVPSFPRSLSPLRRGEGIQSIRRPLLSQRTTQDRSKSTYNPGKRKLTSNRCQVDFLGYMDYVLVASPRFQKKYFTQRRNVKKNLLDAPAVIFDAKDKLHRRYLHHFFNINDDEPQYHVVPSVCGFRRFALLGYGYALIPKIDIMKELKQGKLVELFPKKVWQMPLYWHRWTLKTEPYETFNRLLIDVARAQLNQIKMKS